MPKISKSGGASNGAPAPDALLPDALLPDALLPDAVSLADEVAELGEQARASFEAQLGELGSPDDAEPPAESQDATMTPEAVATVAKPLDPAEPVAEPEAKPARRRRS